jgi:hypothetical protein
MLRQQGFHAQVAQLQACVDGSREPDVHAWNENGARHAIPSDRLLPGSNQPAPPEKNAWNETWKGPSEDAWEEGEEDADAGMFDGEELLGQVISTPHTALLRLRLRRRLRLY